jgi:isoquinoline 1-oxidoreductase subunit beta
MNAINHSRRSFLIGSTATGLVMGFVDPFHALSAGQALAAGKLAPTVWFDMGADGVCTVHVAKAEMGQHVGTALAQLVAEELELAWKDVRIDYPTANPKFNDPMLGALITGGSWSVNFNYDAMSRAGAAGRITLVEAGSKLMNVPAAECTAKNSRVSHAKSKKSMSYAEIVAKGKVDKTWSADDLKAIKLKPASAYTLVGHSVPALDVPSKSDGTAKFGIDASVPGMLYGKPKMPPVRYGAKVKKIDDSAAKKVKGFVKAVAVEDPTGTTSGWVVAIADTWPNAKAAAEALKVEYDLGPNAKVSSDAIIAEAKKLQADESKSLLFVKEGDSAAAMGSAASTIEAEYITHLAIHAPLEPQNALVEPKGGQWHVYAGNQFATRSGGIAAAILGVKPEQVTLHQFVLGGGFGRRLDCDNIVAACAAAKAVMKPVKLIYGREDDMAFDYTRPLTYQKVKAGLDANGKIVAMEQHVVSSWPTARWEIPAFLDDSVDKKGKVDAFTLNGSDHWYTVPNHTVRTTQNALAQAATPSGQLRSVAPAWTFWAVESFMDEAAHKAGVDPVEFRLKHLDGAGKNAAGATRLANAIRVAAGRGGWGKQLPKGSAQGFACVSAQERATATWTACVAEVSVASSGAVKVDKLTIAMDVGTAVNPDGVKAQIEGSCLWGMSLALKESASMKDGAIEQSNFHDYTPVRMSDVPALDISIIANGEPARGCGEPAVTVVGPAIANAVFKAVGARVRTLPLTPDAVKKAMSA